MSSSATWASKLYADTTSNGARIVDGLGVRVRAFRLTLDSGFGPEPGVWTRLT